MEKRIFEIYAHNINSYTNRPRDTKLYITLAATTAEAIEKARKKHTDGEWKFSAEVIDDDLHLIDGWQE